VSVNLVLYKYKYSVFIFTQEDILIRQHLHCHEANEKCFHEKIENIITYFL